MGSYSKEQPATGLKNKKKKGEDLKQSNNQLNISHITVIPYNSQG